MMLRRFRLEELEKATNHFSEECLIGSGAFGNVYRGTLDVEGTLAIKKARVDSYTSTAEFRNGKPQTAQATVGVYEVFCVTDGCSILFGAEVKLLSIVKHRNLVGLVGYCDEAGPNRAQALVYEYVSNGSLLEYIVGRGGRVLTWRQRVNIAIGAAKGKISGFLARPSLERSSVEDILDANLLLEPCNMEMMLKMGQLGLRCVVKVPKQRPTMTQVWQELEASLYSAESFINKQPSRGSRRHTGNSHAYTDHGGRHTTDNDHSHSFISVDGVGLQRFHVEMDSMSFQSTSMRCLEADTISLDIDKYNLKGIREEPSVSMFEYLSIPRD
ncbi:hypothetical protein RJ639_031022 [Escallonia herrerae]|uniref:non-specific serine/threonine protein kinase n=1 Tax=Escallonia herrerae TaxID=1293975 RepID=A0AA88X7W1_9ASTE|nr:hypothetical protein RJ639_031022 [Escallonia herrerae]